MKRELSILWANIINTYRIQTAYFFENWASILSTTFYTLTMLLFIKILFSNVKTFAGYNENEMFFFLFIAQLNFYVDWLWSTNNISYLIDCVREGELDLILVKPIPALFYVTFKEISIINRIKDSLPNLLLLSLIVDWHRLVISADKILYGICIFIFGQIAWHCFRFLFALPVFFIGQSSQIYQISGTLGATNEIPLEGFPSNLRNIFSTFIPSLIAAQMSTSVILGKSDPIKMIILSSIMAIIFLILKQVGWVISLKKLLFCLIIICKK